MIDCRMVYGQKSGIAYYLDHLTQCLARIDTRNRYTLFYVSGTSDRSRMMHVDAPNFETRALRVPNRRFVRLFRDSSLPYRLMRSIRWGWDVVHEPGFEPLPLAPRSVLTLHDLLYFRLPHHMAPSDAAFYQRRQREAARNASVVVTDSEYTRRAAIEILGLEPEKVRTVLLGVSPEALGVTGSEEDARRDLAALGIQKPFLLSIGDFFRRKNYLSALEGFARLPPALRNEFQYVIAGAHVEPAMAAEMQETITRHGLNAAVLLPGYVSHDARRTLMTRAAALVYPSIYEGFGLPPLEAMAVGVPTVSSASSSIPEVVGDAGLLVPDYENPDAWAEALTHILTDDRLRQEYVTRGRVRAASFTWERTARETLKAYELAAAT